MVKKLVVIMFVLVLGLYLLFHFKLIGFAGDGNLGLGGNGLNTSAVVNPEIRNVNESEMSFHFENDQIFQKKGKEKQVVSIKDFTTHLEKARATQRPVHLIFVEENTTDGFYRQIKELIEEWDVVIRESRLGPEESKD